MLSIFYRIKKKIKLIYFPYYGKTIVVPNWKRAILNGREQSFRKKHNFLKYFTNVTVTAVTL